MKIRLDQHINEINVEKVRRVTCVTLKNYRPDLNIDFLPGAIEINTFQANKRHFKNIQEFYVHIKIMPYINFLEVEVPRHLLRTDLIFEALDQDKFEYYVNGYLESFRNLTEDSFWNCKIITKGFRSGYKLETNFSELILVGEFEDDYYCFTYQSID